MRRCVALSWIAGLATLLSTPATAQLVINELMADNETAAEDPQEPGTFEDWIEVYNGGDTAADLGNLYLTDDLGDPTRWQIPPGLRLGAGEFIVFWADGEDDQGDTHTNFKLSSGGEEVGLFAADGATPIDSIVFGEQEADASFGRFPDGSPTWCFPSRPTPGEPNSPCDSGSAGLSRPGGTFVEPFLLELTSDNPTAEIFYTLDRSEPSNTAGMRYQEPIPIGSSTWVRARVYVPDLEPGPVVSEVYLALASDVSDFESNLPLVVIDTFGVDVDDQSESNRPFRPLMSVFIDTDEEAGRATITDAPDYAGYGGMHVRGESTADYAKKQYAFETWNEESEDKSVPLLGFPPESDWVLQAPYSDKTLMRNHLMYRWSNLIGRYAVRTRFVEVFIQPRGRAVSRSDYRGVYVFMERIKRDESRVAITKLEPTDSGEPEITGGYLLRKDWLGGETFFRTEIYNDALIYLDPKPDEITSRQRVWIKGYFDDFEAALAGPNFDDPDEGYAKYIDVGSFIDHHLLVEMARNVDGFVLSTYLFKDRGRKVEMGPIWDYNGSLGGADYFCSYLTEGWHHEFDGRDCGEGGESFPADNMDAYHWYERLFEDPGFRQLYALRWAELRQDVLRTDRLLQDVEDTVTFLTDNGADDNPVDRNFDRWRILNTRVWPNFLTRGTYREHVDWMKTWLTGRLEWMDSALTIPPALSHPGGRVEEGLEVTMTVPEGEIFYTLNGPDPKANDDSVAAEAIAYSGPVIITENIRIRARARVDDRLWSELVEASYFISLPPLVVTEIMYDPPEFPEDIRGSTSSYEFIEFLNAGNEPIDLTGVRVVRTFGDGFRTRFDFTENGFTTLVAGAHVVIARNLEAFRSRYGNAPVVAGAFTATLNNREGIIAVLGAADEPIVDLNYSGSWYPSTNGEGHSLVLVDPSAPPETWSQQEAWRPSTAVGGSPGFADPSLDEAGLQLPGDANQDRSLDLADGLSLLLTITGQSRLPCVSEAANEELLDINGDQRLDLADALQLLNYLFLSGARPALGIECVPIVGCPNVCDAGP